MKLYPFSGFCHVNFGLQSPKTAHKKERRHRSHKIKIKIRTFCSRDASRKGGKSGILKSSLLNFFLIAAHERTLAMYKTYDFCLMLPRANLCVEQMAGKQSGGQRGGKWGHPASSARPGRAVVSVSWQDAAARVAALIK